LSLGVAIGKIDHGRNIEVHLFEATPEFTNIGAGLTIFRRTWEILRLLGCQELVTERAFEYPRMGSREMNNDIAFVVRKSDEKDGYTFLNLSIAGASFHNE
jgi:salicylate hydroxylase